MLDDEITTANILVRGRERDDCMELLVAVLLVQVHAVGKHFLDVTNLDWHVGREVGTVDVDATRIDIIEAPDPEVALMVVEVTSSLEVKRLVLLDRH